MKATHYKDNGGPAPNYYAQESGKWMYFSKVLDAWVESLAPADRLEMVLRNIA